MAPPAAQRKLFRQLNSRIDDLVFDAFTRVHKQGRVWYVDSQTGSDSYGGRAITAPFATLPTAMAQVTANQGDVVVVLPRHAETITSSITVKAGTRIFGLEHGNQRPVITLNGATDMFSMSGAGSEIANMDLTIVTTDAATALIDVSAAKCSIKNIKMIPSATSVNVVDCITLASGANDVLIDNVSIFNTTVAVNSFLSIEAAVARMVLQNCYFFGDVATAGIIDAATATQILIRNNFIATIGTNIPACILDSNPTGNAYRNHMYGTDATIANNVNWGSALQLGENFVRGGTGSGVSATSIIPALDT